MSQQYSHRNGETEPPTTDGYFWFKGTLQDETASGLVDVFTYQDRVDLAPLWEHGNYPAACFVGRWWGPVLMPWESNA